MTGCVTEGSTHLLDNVHKRSLLQRCCARLRTIMANFTRSAAGRVGTPQAVAMRRGLRLCHGLGRKPYQLDRESGLGGGTEGAPGVVELDMSYTENVGRLV